MGLTADGHCRATAAGGATEGRLAALAARQHNAVRSVESPDVEGSAARSAAIVMVEKLRVVFNSPQSGYMSVGLRACGREFAAAVSCRPNDALLEMLSALAQLARGQSASAAVRWNCEPDELDFRFESDNGRLKFSAVHHAKYEGDAASGRTVFEAEGARAEILAAFRDALEELRADIEVDAFESNWRRKFPEQAWREFSDAVEGL